MKDKVAKVAAKASVKFIKIAVKATIAAVKAAVAAVKGIAAAIAAGGWVAVVIILFCLHCSTYYRIDLRHICP